ncbi:MAG: hypothetical protein V1859_00030 [archaeon]
MESIEVLDELFDSKKIAVIKLFIKDDTKEYYLREVAKLTKTSPATTYRILNKLLKLKILRLIEFKKTKLYILEQNKTTEFLKTVLKIDKRVIESFVDLVKIDPNVTQIILVGKEEENRANLILIGEGINSNEIKRICADTKDKYNFTITTFMLTQEQYEQMIAMGLYPGMKKVLYKR